MRFPHLAQRLFNVPLAIHPRKTEIVMAALAGRLGIGDVTLDGRALKPGDLADDDDAPFTQAAEWRPYQVIDGIAAIPVEGTLVNRLGSLVPWSGMTGYDGIRACLGLALDDDEVRGIALDIDSPGGEVAGCFDLADAIYAARGRKPVHAILADNAFSAAYALASAADSISVPRTGGTGSVGVVCLHVDLSKALSGAGIAVTIIRYGEKKYEGSPYEKLSGDALTRIQADTDTMGELFVETVARNRDMTAAAVRATQAGTFLGQAGVDIGFADAVAAPSDAFAALASSL